MKVSPVLLGEGSGHQGEQPKRRYFQLPDCSFDVKYLMQICGDWAAIGI